MRELHYGNGTLVVSFDVCEAVFDYAVALAESGRADVVTIPILHDGSRAESNLVLGPASQLFCTPADDVDVDLDDPELVAHLRQRIAELQPVRPVVMQAGEAVQEFTYADDYE